MGMGHVERCRVLADLFKQRLEKSAAIEFLSLDHEEGIKRIQGFGYCVHKIPLGLSEEEGIARCSNILSKERPDIFIADALGVRPDKMALFKDSSSYLVSIDDTKEGRLLADIAINGLYYPSEKKEGQLELIGPEYLILRKACSVDNRPDIKIRPGVKRILVAQGGSDTYGVTTKIARALEGIDAGVEIILLLGSAFKHKDELEAVLRKSGREFKVDEDIEDVVGLFSTCDIAVTAAGQTMCELAAIGVPSIVLTQEYKEIETADRFGEKNLIINLGLSEDISEERIHNSVAGLIKDYGLRKSISAASRKAIDGLGAERIVEIILEKQGGNR